VLKGQVGARQVYTGISGLTFGSLGVVDGWPGLRPAMTVAGGGRGRAGHDGGGGLARRERERAGMIAPNRHFLARQIRAKNFSP